MARQYGAFDLSDIFADSDDYEIEKKHFELRMRSADFDKQIVRKIGFDDIREIFSQRFKNIDEYNKDLLRVYGLDMAFAKMRALAKLGEIELRAQAGDTSDAKISNTMIAHYKANGNLDDYPIVEFSREACLWMVKRGVPLTELPLEAIDIDVYKAAVENNGANATRLPVIMNLECLTDAIDFAKSRNAWFIEQTVDMPTWNKWIDQVVQIGASVIKSNDASANLIDSVSALVPPALICLLFTHITHLQNRFGSMEKDDRYFEFARQMLKDGVSFEKLPPMFKTKELFHLAIRKDYHNAQYCYSDKNLHKFFFNYCYGIEQAELLRCYVEDREENKALVFPAGDLSKLPRRYIDVNLYLTAVKHAASNAAYMPLRLKDRRTCLNKCDRAALNKYFDFKQFSSAMLAQMVSEKLSIPTDLVYYAVKFLDYFSMSGKVSDANRNIYEQDTRSRLKRGWCIPTDEGGSKRQELGSVIV